MITLMITMMRIDGCEWRLTGGIVRRQPPRQTLAVHYNHHRLHHRHRYRHRHRHCHCHYHDHRHCHHPCHRHQCYHQIL